ncbi:uncharacterized protein EI90DRAFT_3160391 [Cantharellus anzutake]|uniref:uncharacterized protein n=1 Tax=Cantharellus anzutake TaxID=1750568 RepID=UPI001908E752|nr:uncharacterized protein EI90DRAFT_3160391 [Cantharellus anzutake]KAF8311679.1 hypothetical protein EI90DRAFT_3160391 [Cantharellus anzutake]
MPPSTPSAGSSTSNPTSIQVAVRIRPPTTHDASSIPTRFQRTVIHPSSATTLTVDNVSGPPTSTAVAAPPSPAASSSKKQTFAFDQVHAPEATQFQLFTSTAAPLVSRFVEGYNCTILAYGQTSSGKTHSMTGVDLDADPNDPTNGMGIIPRAISTIFARANELKRERGSAWQWSLKASFIELYNEDLIDLLAVGDNGMKQDVQIREDKDGTIIWGGLREIPVRSAADVMAILKRGTAHRRTNETDMNAQSSRSHAIFSITLTQKKFNGTITPSFRNGRSSPMPPSTPSPSKIARPGSMVIGSSRVSSPTFGRAPTPSFAAAMSRGGLRPSSALGMRPRTPEVDEPSGEWVTVVSKFHFVDLAGSERLKRTAAQGDRVKEGISINSGLLALGNVISALGDPSRARTIGNGTAIHVPYRDSKLTRLLQDSLGGNAHTLMIACVSPAEWNVGETVNTLKYANRARNIKNKAEIREKEDGWDDLEWLQTMVTKLRKELKALKEGAVTPVTDTEPPTPTIGALPDKGAAKVLRQYGELQGQYQQLRREFVERNEELARLRTEIEERNAPVAGMSRRYEEIVGPVIEEYEKTITAMETELKLSRTALEHTNEMFSEQESELAVHKERTANADGYIEALRARVGKLAEREASTEVYVRDLEAKLKVFADSTTAHDDSIVELHKEITQYKEAEAASAAYIAGLEQRLASADVDIVSLRTQIEKLETDLYEKNGMVASLQGRLDNLLREQADAASWKESLAEREKRVEELEKKMEEWEKVRAETAEERRRLSSVVSEVASARQSLEAEVNSIDIPRLHLPSSPTTSVSTVHGSSSAEQEVLALQQKHSATLSELEEVSSKYRDALREIADLSAQISEAKLNSETSSEVGSEAGGSRMVPRTPSTGRRPLPRRETVDGLGILSIPPSPSAGTSRRGFFRHAASTEGLHSRSLSQSQSLSSELYSAPYSRTSWAQGDSLLSPSSTFPPKALLRRDSSPQESGRSVESLEKEIQRLQEVLKDRENEISILEKSLASPNGNALHDVQEEVEHSTISAAGDGELSPGAQERFDRMKQTVLLDSRREAEEKEAESIRRLDELMRSMAQKESQHVAIVDHLNEELANLRREHDELIGSTHLQMKAHSERNATLTADLAELRSQLSTSQEQNKDVVEKLTKLRQRETELLETRRIVEEAHTKELEGLRNMQAIELQGHEKERNELKSRHEAEFQQLKSSYRDEVSALEVATKQHASENRASLDELRKTHEEAVSALKSQHEGLLKQRASESSAMADKVRADHERAIVLLTAERGEALRRQMEQSDKTINRLREDHEAEIKRINTVREGILTESQEQQAAVIEELQDQHKATIDRKEADFKSDLERAKLEYQRDLGARDEDHSREIAQLLSEHTHHASQLAEELDAAKAQHSIGLAELSKKHDDILQELSLKHQCKLEDLRNAHEEEVERFSHQVMDLRNYHDTMVSNHAISLERAATAASEKHEKEKESLLAEHALAINVLRADHQATIAEVNESLTAAEEEHQQDVAALRQANDAVLVQERERRLVTLAERDAIHSRERESLLKDVTMLKVQLTEAKTSIARAERDFSSQNSAQTVLLEEKVTKMEELRRNLETVREEHASSLRAITDLREELGRSHKDVSLLTQDLTKSRSLASELEEHRSALGDARSELQRTKTEVETLREEKSRQDQILRDLQAQLSNAKNSRSPIEDATPSLSERPQAHRLGSLPPAKLPPLTPPPSIPPPPVPTSIPAVPSVPTDSSTTTMSRSSHGSRPSLDDSVSGRSTPSTSLMVHGANVEKLQVQVIEQHHMIEEQEIMIRTLNKQLTHCESDLQAHMDLVATLETSLTDSERNLRKSRMQANEYAKDRDALNEGIEALRAELQRSQQEVLNARRSVLEEKEQYETRLEEERRAKERTRAQLESRMDEIQRRKSKFVCL